MNEQIDYGPTFPVGSTCYLTLNDCFGSIVKVRVIKNYKGGTVALQEADNGNLLVSHVKNLTRTRADAMLAARKAAQ